MIYLGQAASSPTFFTCKAMDKLGEESSRLQVHAVLAGIFEEQLVYLFCDNSSPLEFFQYPLFKSNLALCILAKNMDRKKP